MKGIGMKYLVLSLSTLLTVGMGVSSGNDANSPVFFGDPRLKELVAAELDVQHPTVADMHKFTSTDSYRGRFFVGDLVGIEHAINLKSLHLHGYRHSDEGIKDIWPLAGMLHLEELVLPFHQIEDINTIGTLANLTHLDLRGNRIADFTPLLKLSKLESLNIRDNPISNQDFDKQLLAIRRNNPNLSDYYDRFKIGQIRIPMIVAGAILAAGLALLLVTAKPADLTGMIVLGSIAGVVGCALGAGAQFLYRPLFYHPTMTPTPKVLVPNGMGLIMGGLFGGLLGAIFFSWIKNRILNDATTPVRVTLYLGLVTGLLCSSLVHSMLMLAYRESQVNKLLIGCLFGAPAGAVLGILTGMTLRMQNQLPSPPLPTPPLPPNHAPTPD